MTLKNCILLLGLFFMLAAIIYVFNRGFDYSDEGFQLLSYRENYTAPFEPIKAHVILKTIPFVPHLIDIRDSRIIRIVLLVLGTIFFSLTSFLFLKDQYNIDKKEFLNYFLLCLVSCLCSYGFLAPSLNYNVINLFFLLLTAGSFILGLRFYHAGFLNASYIFSGLSGFLLAFVFFTKFSTGILFLPISFFTLISFGKKIKFCLLSFFLIVLSFIAGLLLLGAFNPDLAFFLKHFQEIVISFASTTGEDDNVNYISRSIVFFDFVFKVFILVILGSFLAKGVMFLNDFFNRKKKFCSFYLHHALYISLVILIMVCLYISFYFNVLSSIFLLIILFSYFFTWKYGWGFWKLSLHKRYAPVIVLFLGLAMAFSIGTNVGFLTHLIQCIIFFIPIVFYLSRLRDPFGVQFVQIFVLFAVVLVYCNLIYKPYRTYPAYQATASLASQRFHYGNIYSDEVILSSEDIQFLREISDSLLSNGYVKGQPLLVAYSMPGLSYLIGGQNMGGIFWDEKNTILNLKNLSLQDNISLKSTVIISNRDLGFEIIDFLKTRGIFFPVGFKRIPLKNSRFKKKITIYLPIGD